MESFDVIVIGGGSAGYAAARTARESCERVAIVDGSKELGGLCILRGCMPSKTLIYSAEVLHLASMGERFGLSIPEAGADMKGLHERKLKMIGDFKGYRQEQLQSDRFHLIRERASFTGPDTLQLSESGRTLRANAFIIATGSVVNYPVIEGLDLPGIWTSDDVLDLDFLPESAIMLGAGVVACELAQFLHRMGTRVTQIQRSPLILSEASAEAAEAVMDCFRKEGIDLHTGTQLKRIIASEEGGFKVEFDDARGHQEVEACHVINALGRRPAIDELNLGAAEVFLNPKGMIRVNAHQQTDNPRIYAAGDVCGPFEIVHLAIMQGETAARHATGRRADPVDLSTRTGVVFTDPQIASAGLPVEEARKAGHKLEIAEFPFDDHGKSILMEATSGYVKAWADRESGNLIGAECVGKDAGELIHSMAVAVSMGATVFDLLKVHWYHPTLSEIWSYPLEDIAEAIQSSKSTE